MSGQVLEDTGGKNITIKVLKIKVPELISLTDLKQRSFI